MPSDTVPESVTWPSLVIRSVFEKPVSLANFWVIVMVGRGVVTVSVQSPGTLPEGLNIQENVGMPFTIVA